MSIVFRIYENVFLSRIICAKRVLTSICTNHSARGCNLWHILFGKEYGNEMPIFDFR